MVQNPMIPLVVSSVKLIFFYFLAGGHPPTTPKKELAFSQYP